MKVERLRIGLGKSVPTAGPDGEWIKRFYELEATIEAGETPNSVKTLLENLLNSWLSAPQSAVPSTPEPRQVTSKPTAPGIASYIRQADWRSYTRKGEPAKPDEDAWTFRDKNPELANFILKEGKSARDFETGFELKFSGAGQGLIGRRRLKQAK